MKSKAEILKEFSLFSMSTGGIGSWLTDQTHSDVFERLGRIDEEPLSAVQLNQLLVMGHEAPVGDGFDRYYWLQAPGGFVLDTAFVEPRIAEIFVSPDGIVLARPEGDPGANHFLGSYADVMRNWLRLIAAAGLSQREFVEAQCLFASKVGFLGPTSA